MVNIITKNDKISQNEDKETFLKMVNFLGKLGITVHLNTKARGHQGFYLNNRIDISKNIL